MQAQIIGAEEAQAQMLQVGKDPRPVMRAAYELFSGRADVAQVRAAPVVLSSVVRQ